MFILQFVARLVKILRSAASPTQISWGFIIGMIIGLTPLWSLHNLILLILIIILNVNIATVIFSFIIFSGIAYLLDPIFHNIGFILLADASSLRPLWTTLYNIPVLALSKYNNTVVLGSLVTSVILLFPVYLLIKKSVVSYRENIDVKIQKWKIMKLVKGSKIFSIYERIKNLGD
jgi:uncharacterized protein (TIGR03546 family)